VSARLSADELIDRLVEKQNAGGAFERFPADELPEFLRTEQDPEHPGWFSWRIVPIAEAPWVDTLERKLFKPLPPTLRSLVLRYAFMEFEIGKVLMCPNTGQDIDYELAKYVGSDRNLQEVLVPAGYLHFARQWTGDYDPICFDTNRGYKREYPIVQIDHEEILCNRRLKVVAELAPSFRRLVEGYLQG
jgi:hypothetical protein